jgi:signal transduction histidine kinase
VLARFGKQLAALPTPETLLPTIITTIQQTLKLAYVAIQLEGAATPAAELGRRPAQVLQLPLVYGRERIGDLLVAPRPGEPALRSDDLQLLDLLVRQAGAAVHAVRITADLQRSREQLVSARAAERKRLRRDLHDGLGPSLATMTLQADTARGLVRSNPDEAERVLEELTQQSQATMQDVRGIIHALYPPVLDDLGLEAALRGMLATFNRSAVAITLHMPQQLGPLPAAVEVAIYRIAQEALNNVVKHSHAHSCCLRLTMDGPTLVLEVRDDGVGLADEYQRGVGFTSMRERAEELGGRWSITSSAGTGTHVIAHIPVGRDV